ncbi:nucleoid-associated protein [Pseudoalteromonas luteoviolacea]|uniref:Nucleoid-associated protein NdpA n=1 Tax=Pseudoalteromonas luteoviolacea DSM 6061 TaxID=1365250 RepID=A0A161ZZE1_9GAMM|nr:nucleoid-associated protein [Pseudoalteromonas luteoviolacea]KZN39831.1 hypothetical protein N475_13820 [Pseudoalteromonas luteoviolacea DSM 6061]MBE0385770.1 nucleoid-associated protein [Pseudoalteromonas luteoviolacea DSM 6061]
MAIKHLIVHVVKRDKDGEKLFTQHKEEENKLDDSSSVLTNGLLDIFKSAHLNIGEFALDGDTESTPIFEKRLSEYYKEDHDKLQCTNFVELTTRLAKHFEHVLVQDSLHSVKGGYLVFYEYEQSGHQWLAVAILTKSDGVDISNNLEVVLSQILDLGKLQLGATVNLTQWHDQLTSRYIKFRKGVGKEFRDYFEKFVGCQRDKDAAKQETRFLKAAIEGYSIQSGFSKEVTSQKVERAHSHIKECIKEGTTVTLTGVANAVFPNESNEFSIYAKQEHNISEEVAIDNSTLNTYLKISGRGKGISISFDRELLDNVIKYEDDKLIFEQIPDSLRKDIEQELEKRKQDQKVLEDKCQQAS